MAWRTTSLQLRRCGDANCKASPFSCTASVTNSELLVNEDATSCKAWPQLDFTAAFTTSYADLSRDMAWSLRVARRVALRAYAGMCWSAIPFWFTAANATGSPAGAFDCNAAPSAPAALVPTTNARSIPFSWTACMTKSSFDHSTAGTCFAAASEAATAPSPGGCGKVNASSAICSSACSSLLTCAYAPAFERIAASAICRGTVLTTFLFAKSASNSKNGVRFSPRSLGRTKHEYPPPFHCKYFVATPCSLIPSTSATASRVSPTATSWVRVLVWFGSERSATPCLLMHLYMPAPAFAVAFAFAASIAAADSHIGPCAVPLEALQVRQHCWPCSPL